MADPVNPASRPKWPWIAVLVVLGILFLVWVFSPSGERDGQAEDPIVTPEFSEQAPGATTDLPPADRTGQDMDQDMGGQAAPPPEPFAPGGDPE